MEMSISLKKATKKTNINHNNRNMTRKEKERNSHIDYSRSHLNKYLVQKDIREVYEEEFGPSLEKYNAKQKRKDRKIKDYYRHILKSKKTATQQEMIVQIGDESDFESEENWKLANEILLEWLEGFQERNPNLKVYNSVIHNDEASCHGQLNFVPVASGYKRGLEKQVSFDRAIIQQDDELDKKRPFADWRDKEVALLEELMQERGIERKLVGTNDYKDVNDYKKKKDLEREVENLQQKRDKLTEELSATAIEQPQKIYASKESKNHVLVHKKDIKKYQEQNELIPKLVAQNQNLKAENEELDQENFELLEKNEIQEAQIYQMRLMLETAQERMEELVENGKKLWNKAITYASKFYPQAKKVTPEEMIDKTVEKDDLSDFYDYDDEMDWGM